MKLDHLGDFVMGLPAFEALRNYFPNDEITLVCGSWNKIMAEETGLFDRVVTHDYFPRNARNWNRRSPEGPDHFAALLHGTYDIAVDLRVDADTRHLLSLVDAGTRVGLGTREEFPHLDVAVPFNQSRPGAAIAPRPPSKGRWWPFRSKLTEAPVTSGDDASPDDGAGHDPARFDRIHRSEQFSLLVRLLAERAGVTGQRSFEPGETAAADPVPELARIKPGDRVICVAPISNSELRDWPLANYVELVRLLLERRDCRVVLLGSPEHERILNEILRKNGANDRLVNLAGKTKWTELPSLFRRSDLVICNNSGIGHFAAACGAPVAAIFCGSHLPEEWGPRGSGNILVMTTDLPCSPCGQESFKDCGYDHKCMKLWTPESVLGQIETLLPGIPVNADRRSA